MLEALDSAAKGSFENFKEEFLTGFEEDTKDPTWSPEDEEFHSMTVYNDVVDLPNNPNVNQFSQGDFVELERVKDSVAYYGSPSGFNNNGTRLRPSLKSMSTLFQFIKDHNHLQKLCDYENTS
ncbi:hypothetical protein L5515_015341 [Caenorhabditis briggsae]|uniref:Uncharacterized protein n=1 Tax=Caenorhabditis briggsae TaxID=6238 RepID=A0AAE9J817_CAEBR|nr:hypothetical protein L5515_015341 [Caenorhabditis briggsae]